MWIKRKEYEKMKNNIDYLKTNIDYLKTNILILQEIHNFKQYDKYVVSSYSHENIANDIKINTKAIPNLTLEELAKYVIDGEPIVREDTIKVKKIYE